jgi:hypothetical protein
MSTKTYLEKYNRLSSPIQEALSLKRASFDPGIDFISHNGNEALSVCEDVAELLSVRLTRNAFSQDIYDYAIGVSDRTSSISDCILEVLIGPLHTSYTERKSKHGMQYTTFLLIAAEAIR